MNQKSIIVVLGVVVIISTGITVYFATINKTSQPVAPTPKVVQQPVPTPVVQQPTQPANEAKDLKISKGWLEGTRTPLNLVLAETTASLSGYSGNKFTLVFSKDSICTFAESESPFSCADSKVKWGVGDRVRAYGLIKGSQILVNKLEIVSALPVEKW